MGSRAKFECYTEVVFKGDSRDPKTRPDGLLVLRTGRKSWSALGGAKIGRTELNVEQIQTYLQLAKAHRVDAVITLSSQFTAMPAHHPLKVSRSDQRGVKLYHWSWMFMLTQSMLVLNDSENVSTEQAFILSEIVRYFRHDSTGVSTFDRMNAEWPDLVSLIKSGAGPNKSSDGVQNSVASWHQETRDTCPLLSPRRNPPGKLARACDTYTRISRRSAGGPAMSDRGSSESRPRADIYRARQGEKSGAILFLYSARIRRGTRRHRRIPGA